MQQPVAFPLSPSALLTQIPLWGVFVASFDHSTNSLAALSLSCTKVNTTLGLFQEYTGVVWGAETQPTIRSPTPQPFLFIHNHKSQRPTICLCISWPVHSAALKSPEGHFPYHLLSLLTHSAMVSFFRSPGRENPGEISTRSPDLIHPPAHLCPYPSTAVALQLCRNPLLLPDLPPKPRHQ